LQYFICYRSRSRDRGRDRKRDDSREKMTEEEREKERERRKRGLPPIIRDKLSGTIFKINILKNSNIFLINRRNSESCIYSLQYNTLGWALVKTSASRRIVRYVW